MWGKQCTCFQNGELFDVFPCILAFWHETSGQTQALAVMLMYLLFHPSIHPSIFYRIPFRRNTVSAALVHVGSEDKLCHRTLIHFINSTCAYLQFEINMAAMEKD